MSAWSGKKKREKEPVNFSWEVFEVGVVHACMKRNVILQYYRQPVIFKQECMHGALVHV